MEQLIESGSEEMASVFAGLFNLAMRIEREQVLRQQAQGQLDRLAERLTLPAPELDVVIGNAILPNSGEVKFPTPSW